MAATTKTVKIELPMDLVFHLVKKAKCRTLDEYLNKKLREDIEK
jgi:hypothetical protein